MHVDQVDLTTEQVGALVRAQLPQWADLPVLPVASSGTVNALFRVGEDVVLRFPLQPRAEATSLEYEQQIARMLAGALSFEVPKPLALGRPDDSYSGWWSAWRWIAGRPAEPSTATPELALDLALLVRELHATDTAGRTWDGRSRGGPLATRADAVDEALAASSSLVDVSRLGIAWQSCLAAAGASSPDVWIHADLMPGNLLVRDGRLVAVIDLESVCVGDAAVDLMPAWNLLPSAARAAYRQALDVDDATWQRGRGWALSQAIIALPYYVDSNPAMARTARHTLAALLD